MQPRSNIDKIQNINSSLKLLKEKLQLDLSQSVNISRIYTFYFSIKVLLFIFFHFFLIEIVNCNSKSVMDLIWEIIYFIHIKPISYGNLNDRFALLAWCQEITQGYEGVHVIDFTDRYYINNEFQLNFKN